MNTIELQTKVFIVLYDTLPLKTKLVVRLMLPSTWVVVFLILWVIGAMKTSWAAWFTLLAFAVNWSHIWYLSTKGVDGSMPFHFGTRHTVIIWWVLLAWTLNYPTMDKNHLIWLAPSVLLVSTVVMRTIVLTIRSLHAHQLISMQEHLFPSGIERYSSYSMLILLPLYIGVLRHLTF